MVNVKLEGMIMTTGPVTGPLPTIVRESVDFELIVSGDKTVGIPALFDYAAHEPFSVRASFQTSDGSVEWVISRDLLSQGIREPAGDGDVSVWVEGDGDASVYCLQLTSPNGQALMEAPLHQVRSFLNRTFEVVPSGSETSWISIDNLIDQLLDDGGSSSAA